MSAKVKTISIKKEAVKRQTFTLTEQEQSAFGRLCARSRFYDAADIWCFWRSVAQARGLDGMSIIANPWQPGRFSALPVGHDKQWCWPMPLTCGAKPEAVMI